MTIEQRANEWMKHIKSLCSDDKDIMDFINIAEEIFVLTYIQGAIDQKAIDDEEWRKDMRYINIHKR